VEVRVSGGQCNINNVVAGSQCTAIPFFLGQARVVVYYASCPVALSVLFLQWPCFHLDLHSLLTSKWLGQIKNWATSCFKIDTTKTVFGNFPWGKDARGVGILSALTALYHWKGES